MSNQLHTSVALAPETGLPTRDMNSIWMGPEFSTFWRILSCSTGNQITILKSPSPWPSYYTDWSLPDHCWVTNWKYYEKKQLRRNLRYHSSTCKVLKLCTVNFAAVSPQAADLILQSSRCWRDLEDLYIALRKAARQVYTHEVAIYLTAEP